MAMVDIFALSISHGLLVLAALRLMARDDLDHEGEPRPRFGTRRKPPLMNEEQDEPA
jgi:hypothetical protein